MADNGGPVGIQADPVCYPQGRPEAPPRAFARLMFGFGISKYIGSDKLGLTNFVRPHPDL